MLWNETDPNRYTMFIPLYPIGIGAEWWLMYRSVGPAGEVSRAFEGLLYFLLALYVPGKCTSVHGKESTCTNVRSIGAYTMFTHMTKQRRKALGRRCMK